MSDLVGMCDPEAVAFPELPAKDFDDRGLVPTKLLFTLQTWVENGASCCVA